MLKIDINKLLRLSIVAMFLPVSTALAADPGGVGSNLNSWFKADAGTTVDGSNNITDWDDQSGNNNDSTSVNSDPNLQQDLINYNPGVDFDGNDYVNLPNSTWTSGTGNYSVFIVVILDTDAWQAVACGGNEAQNERFWVGGANSRRLTDAWWGTSDFFSGNNVYTTGVAFMGSYLYDDGSAGRELFYNGNSEGTDSSTSRNHGTGSQRIGARPNLTQILNGKVGEIIAYNSLLSATDQLKVESYLCLKYGLTLDSALDYTDSNGSVFYAATGSFSSYSNDIAGIGRDDTSGLGQVKSKSSNSDALVLIEADGEGTNATPAWTNMTDREFLCWGNNNGSVASWTTTGAPSSYQRLARQWRMSEPNGNVGSVTLSVANTDLPTGLVGDLILLIDGDGDFTSGATLITMTDNSGTWEILRDPGNLEYFTFACVVGTPTYTPTITQTQTPSNTETMTATHSPTPTVTPTESVTSTVSATLTATPSITLTPTQSATATSSPTISPTPTISATRTPTPTISATITQTNTPTPTFTVTQTASNTVSPTSEIAAEDLTRVTVYPNPYKGDTNQRHEIIFFNLPEKAVIRLYSIDGRLVKTLQKDDSGNRLSWAMNNEKGVSVASGVYIYIVKSNGKERRGKIAILQ
jgi:hypothetical protein